MCVWYCRGLESGQEASIIRGLASSAAIQPVDQEEMEVDQVRYITAYTNS